MSCLTKFLTYRFLDLYFSSPNWELSNSVALVSAWKGSTTTYLLSPVFQTCSHIMPMKSWRCTLIPQHSLNFPFRKLLFFSQTRCNPRTFTAYVAVSNEIASGEEKWYFTPVHNPSQSQSDHDDVRSLCNFSFSFIFSLLKKLLFFSLTSYPAEIACFSLPNQGLSNGIRVVEVYWNKIVDPSRSPCLKIVVGKIERRNFLFLCHVLLKIAYFNSGNRWLSIAVLPKELRRRKIVDPCRGAS